VGVYTIGWTLASVLELQQECNHHNQSGFPYCTQLQFPNSASASMPYLGFRMGLDHLRLIAGPQGMVWHGSELSDCFVLASGLAGRHGIKGPVCKHNGEALVALCHIISGRPHQTNKIHSYNVKSLRRKFHNNILEFSTTAYTGSQYLLNIYVALGMLGPLYCFDIATNYCTLTITSDYSIDHIPAYYCQLIVTSMI
jgi:hypothetical protein